ncbi:MAG TPA: AmmeMemoRadiSam system radical SAM enzyme [Gemmatimonadales bacterium]|nr:AmmeMemoRadiSam system radical SAM enzyme [Gemmatimonadales bacterium]
MPDSIARPLDARTTEGRLYNRLPDGSVRCYACGHRCLIREGRRGICKVRFNQDGRLRVPHGYVAALQCDPVEKKPFFHVLPGADALTFGMLGCDFHCGYCQNWLTSQALRDERSSTEAADITAEALVAHAARQDARLVVSSYNEPLITAEWAAEVFALARPQGFVTGFVSNGNATPEALDLLRPLTDCYKIDLKTMSDRRYRRLGGVLAHVLDAIRLVHERGMWLEVLTLIVPGFSDDPAELREAARYLAAIDPDIPWHLTAFHEDYRFSGMGDTTADRVIRACEIGAEEGLNFVYAGNLPGRVGRWEHTWCPGCRALLVGRLGYRILTNRIGRGGGCPDCGTRIPGIFANPRGSSEPSPGHGWIRALTPDA